MDNFQAILNSFMCFRVKTGARLLHSIKAIHRRSLSADYGSPFIGAHSTLGHDIDPRIYKLKDSLAKQEK